MAIWSALLAQGLQPQCIKHDPDTSRGISFGGGRISGLGSLSAAPAAAAEVTAIAVGNGSTATLGSTDAIALGSQALAGGPSAVAIGLRSNSSATDTLAIGTDANVSATNGVGLGARTSVTAAGGVALGSGSISNRVGLGELRRHLAQLSFRRTPVLFLWVLLVLSARSPTLREGRN